VKLGAKGAMLMSEGIVHKQPTLPGAIVDATGAGDAFNGGFLHEFLRGGNWDDCLRAGNVCGSLAAMAPGGSLGLPAYPEFAKHMHALKARGGAKRRAHSGRV